jgi:YHS domain-containing protein
MITDPVCGKRINRGKAHIVIEYEGIGYALCCPLCQAEFERAPRAYARPALGAKVRKKSRHLPYRGQ